MKSDHAHSEPDPREEGLLNAFVGEQPDGTPEALSAWLASRPEVRAEPGLEQRIQELHRHWRAGLGPIGRADRIEGSSTRRFWRALDPRDRPEDAPPLGSGPSAAEPLETGSRVGRFVLRRFLARGGMGQVWEAEDLELRRTVALKLVLPERLDSRSLELFAREARAGGRLHHPNIVTTLEFGRDDGLSWIAQELVEQAITVKDFLNRARSLERLPVDYYERVAQLVATVAQALHAAHEAGVIHRDVKPANILIGLDERPRLTDFGLARVVDDSFHSVTGDFAGTWAYMSPEQVTAKRMGLDHRTDVFSLGVVLYELLTLRRPFDGDTTHQVAQRIVTYDPPDPTRLRSQCPPALGVICGKALRKDPDRRYATCAELAADLLSSLEDGPIRARPPRNLERLDQWTRRNPVVAAVAAVVLLALVVVSGLLWRNVQINRDLGIQRNLAQARALEASRAREAAERERTDVMRLSASQDLEDLLREERELWPALPGRRAEYARWLQRAEALLVDLPLHRETLEALRGRALPRTEEQRRLERESHPDRDRLERLADELAWRRSALAARETRARVEEPTLAPEDLELGVEALNREAWELVRPDRARFGSEPRGLALARAAAARAAEAERAAVLDTLAWAEFAVGHDAPALEAARRALDASAPEERDAYRERLAELESAAASEGSLEGLEAARARVAALRREVDQLDRRVDARRTWDFPPGEHEARWWNEQLTRLVSGLESMRAELIDAAGTVPVRGWSIPRRVRFAERLALGLAEGGAERAAWDEASAALTARYPGLAIEPQLGLLPLGADPDSGLWEFAHLASGEPPVRRPDGRLELGVQTGIVLVLLPGGEFWMGDQSNDPNGPGFDPEARRMSAPPHRVTLAPYLIAKHELTQAQYERIAGDNPSFYRRASFDPALDAQHPVESLTWDEAEAALARLDLRLPTEAQWEYAIRGGTGTRWFTGDDPASLQGFANLADAATAEMNFFPPTWTHESALRDAFYSHAPVGSLEANPYGLHDLAGNVAEWCLDTVGSYAMPVAPGDGLRLDSSGLSRIDRGGSYFGMAHRAKSAHREFTRPDERHATVGVRAARPWTDDSGPAGRRDGKPAAASDALHR